MEWLLALAFVWGTLQDAADNYDEAAMATAALIQEESDMYDDEADAKRALANEWTVFPSKVKQGDAFMVRADRQGTVEWHNKTYELLPFGTGYYALLPVPVGMKPGEYNIGDVRVTVDASSFETQHLQVTKQQEAMRRNTKRIEQDQLRISEARSNSEPTFLFGGTFLRPVEGRLSTPYGFTRYINGKLSGRHQAIDIAAPEGTPIVAAASGKVVLAEELYLTGNSIYIDHGMSLFSQYAHLSELQVKQGDYVEGGQVIGLVGTTGFSTGPHLHFTFWIHGIQANPDLFFDSSPFHWLSEY